MKFISELIDRFHANCLFNFFSSIYED